VTGSLATNRRR